MPVIGLDIDISRSTLANTPGVRNMDACCLTAVRIFATPATHTRLLVSNAQVPCLVIPPSAPASPPQPIVPSYLIPHRTLYAAPAACIWPAQRHPLPSSGISSLQRTRATVFTAPDAATAPQRLTATANTPSLPNKAEPLHVRAKWRLCAQAGSILRPSLSSCVLHGRRNPSAG